jgi:hypothetical protein
MLARANTRSSAFSRTGAGVDQDQIGVRGSSVRA